MNIFRQLLEKLVCKHKWKVYKQVIKYHSYKGHRPDELPIETRETLVCIKCGAIKRITL
jgi:hypothetical protein